MLVLLVINGISVVLGYYFWTLTIWKLGDWFDKSCYLQRTADPDWFAYAPQVLNFF